ncbi:MAG: S8 family serine peptidase [Gammaproteobacteria bacterium]|nr:S8 family serine peptidase [Gammaproteobacteria bacterium]
MSTRIAAVLAFGILILALVLDIGEPSIEVEASRSKNESLTKALARNEEVSALRASNAFVPRNADSITNIDTLPHARSVEFKNFRKGTYQIPKIEPKIRHSWLDSSVAVERILATAEKEGREWAFGWIQIAQGFDRDQLSAQWQNAGVHVIGFAGEFARVRLPHSRATIEALIVEPGVIGLGIQPPEEKISPKLASLMQTASTEIPLLIGLIEEDTNGTWRSNLEANGVVVGEWLPYARTYSANVQVHAIPKLAGFDYVVSIEPVEIFQVLLDTAVPAMGVDGVRTYDATTGTFSGVTGESVAVGIVDTGLNIAHGDISTDRTSVCGGNFFPDDSGDGQFDLWSDFGGHGTHVTGIIAGSGSVQSQFAGMAPSIQHIRIAKVLDRNGSGNSVTVANGIRYLLGETACEWDGRQTEAIRPLVMNMSLGGPGERDGRGASNRNIDAVVVNGSQLLVLAAGNDGSNGTSNEATAKNVLAVGAVTDAGVVAGFSSHGPTADGRLNPHVVGTGSAIVSAKGNSSTKSYVRYRGTSMAAPAVAGVAALLMDQNPEFHNAPAYAKARLMSSAVKPSRLLGQKEFPLTNTDGPGVFNEEYGLGLVSASTAIRDSAEGHWSHGGDHGAVETGGSYEYEIEIPDDTARLDVVLTWTESPNETIAPSTVVANLDLFMDKDGDCGALACGEFASTSQIDNVEWIVVKDPEPGSYTLRIVAANDFPDSVHAGIAWTTISRTDTPTLTVSAEEQTRTIEAGSSFKVDLEVSTDGFLSAGTTLHMVCRSESGTGCDGYTEAHWLPSSYVVRRDTERTVIDTPVGVTVPLGEVGVGDRKRVTLALPRGVATESHTLFFIASSWNADSGMISIDVLPEGTESTIQAIRPVNDSIANARLMAGETGEAPLDLLLATREPGEPMLRVEEEGIGVKKFFSDDSLNQRNFDPEMQSYARHGSVWFLIEAERSGPYQIRVSPEADSVGTWLAVYEGQTPLDSNRVSAQEGFTEFIAESGETYLVQIWTEAPVRPSLQLTWNQHAGGRPENDDFENRKSLSGNRGVVAGTNYRASLENFEFYGIESVGASTWFSWVAPEAGRFEFDVTPGLRVFVFDGTNTTTLRRVSTMPSAYRDSQFEAAADREYQIVVLDSAERLVPDYRLSWRRVSMPRFGFADNDMMRYATTIDGATGEASIDSFDARTVEPNEDVRTGVGTSWWRWTPPSAGSYVFRLNGTGLGKLAAFAGTSLTDLEFVTDGATLNISTREGLQYWISSGYRADSMFADVDGGEMGRSVSWGPLPSNDLFSSPDVLTGTTGTITADHSFASTSFDEFGHIRGHSSLWWRWEAASDGWQRFTLQDWEAAGLEEESQQGLIAIYRRWSDPSPALLATSDHSYLISGRAEATIRAEAGEEYLVRVALRSTQLGDWNRELSFSYSPVDIPSWQRYVGRIAEISSSDDDIEDDDLFKPSSISLVGESGLLGVATSDGLVAYVENSTGSLTQQAKVLYLNVMGDAVEVQDDVLLHWDSNSNRLYLLQQDGFFEVSDPITAASRLTRCVPDDLDAVIPAQALVDTENENMYVLGEDKIDVYTIRAACDFDHVQKIGARSSFGSRVPFLRASELEGARTIALSSNEERVYASGDEGLATFRRANDGTLTVDTTYDVRRWARDQYRDFRSASVVLGTDGILFVVAARSPSVAVFSTSDQGEGETPEFLDLVSAFYLSPVDFHSYPFFSHVEWPQPSEGCTAVSAYNEGNPAVDVFCDGQVYTVAWDESDAGLYISDWFQLNQSDRFGQFLRDGLSTMSPKKIVENAVRNRNYVLGDGSIGTLHIFDRATRITENPYEQ